MLAQFLTTAIARSLATALAVKKSARGAVKNASTGTHVGAARRPPGDQLPAIACMKGVSICSSDEFIARRIKSHRNAIARYENAIARYEAEAGGCGAQQRATAQRILPQLRLHLAMLESLKSADGQHRDMSVGRRS